MQPFFTGGRGPGGGQSPGEGSATVAAESTEGRQAQADRRGPLRKADLPPKRKGGSNVCVPYLLPLDLEGLPVTASCLYPWELPAICHGDLPLFCQRIGDPEGGPSASQTSREG